MRRSEGDSREIERVGGVELARSFRFLLGSVFLREMTRRFFVSHRNLWLAGQSIFGTSRGGDGSTTALTLYTDPFVDNYLSLWVCILCVCSSIITG